MGLTYLVDWLAGVGELDRAAEAASCWHGCGGWRWEGGSLREGWLGWKGKGRHADEGARQMLRREGVSLDTFYDRRGKRVSQGATLAHVAMGSLFMVQYSWPNVHGARFEAWRSHDS